jgi:hypothetical protein
MNINIQGSFVWSINKGENLIALLSEYTIIF